MSPASICIRALPDLPEIASGSDLVALLMQSMTEMQLSLTDDDVLVLAQKIVSKAEGRHVDLRDVEPSARARDIAATVGKDPRFVEVVLGESSEIVRIAGELLITRHRLGFVMANAGVDRSNLGRTSSDDFVLLLPRDPDTSARNLRERIRERCGVAPAVIISDSFGRPWRLGVVNVALGAAGLPSLIDHRGTPDRDGRRMQTTEVAVADAVAAAAGLVMGEAAEGTPAVHIRGFQYSDPHLNAAALIRPLTQDLFR